MGNEAVSGETDVLIIGGGPAGSTCASLLRRYDRTARVTLVERETFPRDHVGESQLPAIGRVLDEMGCWDKVEAAGFPVKIGATYRWGRSPERWDFEFLPDGEFVGGPRPARYEGERRDTAFQVDRARYDAILLDHARELGCQVLQPRAVRRIERDGDRVTGVALDDGSILTAKTYVDASGHAGILRRAMGVESDVPTSLRNVAVWEYWRNAEWAVKIGVGGTRVQVLSLGYGWIWFIPLGPDRTSIGLIVPAAYLKESGKSLEELYRQALAEEPRVAELLRAARSEGKTFATRDWSFLARRLAGENWYLAGEAAGFADPILAAGMTLAHMGARDVAYAILAERRGEHDPAWLREWYDGSNRTKIGQHIRFADFWYSANGLFSDLQEHTREIARDAGLDLSPAEAWRWLGTGGFVDGDGFGSGHGGYSVGAVKAIAGSFLGTEARYAAAGKNVFRLDLDGAERGWGARLETGRIHRHRTWRRGGRTLPDLGLFGLIVRAAEQAGGGGLTAPALFDLLRGAIAREKMGGSEATRLVHEAYFVLESMICDGWIVAAHDASLPTLGVPGGAEGIIHANRDPVLAR